jgi:hypothetical protein
MSVLDLIPAPYRLAAELAIVVAMTGGAAWFVHHERALGRDEGRAEVQTKWDRARAVQQDQAIADAAANAKETQRRLARQKEAQDAYDTELAQARADADRAGAAADGLRQRAQAYAAAARRAASNPAAVGNSAPAGDPVMVLADVLGKVGDRSRLLAAYADAARRAGKQCEAAYDALSELRK